MSENSSTPISITVVEAYERLGADGLCLLDVRTEEEFKEVRVSEAFNIPLDRLEFETEKLKDFSSILVMCRGGVRSVKATNLLHEKGLSQAINVVGGIMAWQEAGLPTGA